MTSGNRPKRLGRRLIFRPTSADKDGLSTQTRAWASQTIDARPLSCVCIYGELRGADQTLAPFHNSRGDLVPRPVQCYPLDLYINTGPLI